jgi:hypothetical protein
VRDEIKVNCPACPRRGKTPDRKRHLGINPGKNAAKCFRCGFGTNQARAFVERERIDDLALRGVLWGHGVYVEAPDIKLPDGFTRDFAHPLGGAEALDYLCGWGRGAYGLARRGFSRAVVAGYGIGHCPVGTYAHRVVIPVYRQGVLVWWQARDWTGRAERKYLSPAGEKKGILFNLDRAAKSGCILLTEGLFDSLTVPAHGSAMMGKELADEQIELLLAMRPRAVLVGLDTDAESFATRIVNQLWGLVPYVDRLRPPDGLSDFGETDTGQRARVDSWCKAAAMLGAGQ